MSDRNARPAGIFGAGEAFFVGCNYWASHAGTFMWRNWSEETVEADFRALSSHGAQVLRVFPLWPDFQPLVRHTSAHQNFEEMRFGEEPLPDTPAGRAGVDPVMVGRFRRLAELAARYELKLVVGLVTGWMSGRMYVPPAFSGVNVITDPEAVRWQVRMVRFLVSELSSCKAIAAWDLGNECNCMAAAGSPAAAWTWSNAITAAIRVEDPARPVVSGMHSLLCFPDGRNPWSIQDQGEVTDILCTHPYPLFTPHCNLDPVNTFRNAFHATAETRLYTDVGGVPAFVEEAGSLGPSQSSDRVAGDYLNNMLWNSFAHDCRGLLWWCGHDQTELTQTPYDWVGMERELGLLRVDRSPKPTMQAIERFGALLDKLDLRRLPAFRRDAVVLLSRNQDSWGAAYTSFLLAKQAGFDVEFRTVEQTLPDSKLYILPSIRGTRVLSKRCWYELLKRVEAGATLLVTSDGGSLQPFNQPFGVDIETLCRAAEPVRFHGENFDFTCAAEFRVRLSNRSAEVLAADGDGSPVFVCREYGAGKLLFAAAPLEVDAGSRPRAFFPDAPAFHEIYRIAAERAGIRRRVMRTNPALTLTEHELDADTLLVIAVNNLPDELTDTITPAAGWRFERARHGRMSGVDFRLTVPGNSGAVLEFRRG